MATTSKPKPLIPQPGKAITSEGRPNHTSSFATPRDPAVSKLSVGDVPTIPTLSSEALTTGKGGGALRPIDQKFEVNPANGTLSLSLPLQVTKSRNDFQPTLTLDYDSGGGSGPFGMGWQLSLESVTRKTSKHIPTYTDTDVFLLSGSDDLVPLNGSTLEQDGYTVRRFLPRVHKEYMRIEMWTNNADPDDVFWRTISGSNSTKFYGRREESRIVDRSGPGTARIFSWLLCEAYDSLGNAMLFNYKPEDSAGISPPTACEQNRPAASGTTARYIKSIKYGNTKPCRDLESWNIIVTAPSSQWHFEVVFDYGEHDLKVPTTVETEKWKPRQDVVTSCSSGFEVRSYRLCRRILMFHHFPELEVPDYLVSSHSFEYQESPSSSVLTSTSFRGHAWHKGVYQTQAYAPFSFQYNQMPSLETLTTQEMRPTALQAFSARPPNRDAMRWVDLYGEGSPGLLFELNGAWYYQRNECALASDDSSDDEASLGDGYPENLGPMSLTRQRPNTQPSGSSYFEDLDGNGLQDVVVLDEEGRAQGYYECLQQDDWTSMHEFTDVINLNNKVESLKRADLTGSGLGDMVFRSNMDNTIVWHEALGKEGFNRAMSCAAPDGFPDAFGGDSTTGVYFTDMTGDGLADAVKISNGYVFFWPNMGYGKFGCQVTMANAPLFDSQESFDLERLHLVDLDGSGTTDVVYLSSRGGASAYYNHCGNSWSDPVKIGGFPEIHSLASVFTVDLLGKGTSCLCWTGPEGAARNEVVIHYLDLGGPAKPRLLKSWDNGRGLSARIKYSPSTRSYLVDEREGKPWKTKLPFPVQTIKEVVEKDAITNASVVTKYRYHDGYYDGRDREFRGFGMVEVWETESFGITPEKKPYTKPTLHSKLWFHTGAPAPVSFDDAFGDTRIQYQLPTESGGSWEQYRAMKGWKLRSETYGLDGSEKERTPYMVSEFSQQLVQVQQVQLGSHPAIFMSHERETLSLHYEREKSEPRIEHDLVLNVNLFGNIVMSLKVHYGRLSSALSNADSCRAQETTHAIVKHTQYTNPIDKEAECFYKPVVCAVHQTHLSGSGQEKLVALDRIGKMVDENHKFTWKEPLGTVLDKPDSWTVGASSEARVYFLSRDMSRQLPLGAFEAYSVADQSFELALTKSLTEEFLTFQLVNDERQSVTDLVRAAGYVDLDGDGAFWKPSHRAMYSGTKPSGPQHNPLTHQLSLAKASFYMPVGVMDQFGYTSYATYDKMWLLPVQTTDAMGNVTVSTIDYRNMRPKAVEDPNGNIIGALFDPLGNVAAVARSGKKGKNEGDSLQGIDVIVPEADIYAFLISPRREQAPRWIGNAGTRRLRTCGTVDLQVNGETVTLPPLEIVMTRTEHTASSGHLTDSPGDIEVTVTYFNGRGAKVQTFALTAWDNGTVSASWAMSSCSVPDRKEKIIKTLESFNSVTAIFIPPIECTSSVTLTFYDALDRAVGTLNPDHSWTKVTRTSWSESTFDAGDFINVKDPCTDRDLSFHFSQIQKELLLPLWRESQLASEDKAKRAAAEKSVTYADNPITTHRDCHGRAIHVDEKAGSLIRTSRFAYNVFGNVVSEWDGRGRLVQRSRFDLLGRCILLESMDAGTKTCFYDCLDGLLVERHSRGVQKRNTYDGLHRNVENWVSEPGTDGDGKEYLASRFEYGEKLPEPRALNLRGALACVYDQSGKHALAYDFKGNQVTKSSTLATEYKARLDWNKTVTLEDKVYVSRSGFDALDRVTTSTDCNGTETRWEYALSSGVRAIYSRPNANTTVWTCHVKDTEYTADGLVERIDYGNGAHSAYQYDAQTRELVNKRTWRDDGVVLDDLSYTYDAIGNISEVVDSAQQIEFFRNKVVSPRKSYWYDGFLRLVKATGRETVSENGNGSRSTAQRPSGSDSEARGILREDGRQVAEYTETYKYDLANNLMCMRHESADEHIAGWTRKYHYKEPSLLEAEMFSNRLSWTSIGDAEEKYTYDGDAGKVGCITFWPGASRIGWDPQNKLRCVATQKVNEGEPEITWFVYDHSGARIRKVTEAASSTDPTGPPARLVKQTIYIGTAEKHCKYAGKEAPASTTLTSLIGSTPNTRDAPLASIEATISESNSTGTQPLTRYHISESLEIDDSALVVSYEEYSPFGSSTVLSCRRGAEAPRRYRFAAYRRDRETGGMYACGARYYAPWLGRWTSPDPLGTEDGMNVFAYVSNDPINWFDPSGYMKNPKKIGKRKVAPGRRGGISGLKTAKQMVAVHKGQSEHKEGTWWQQKKTAVVEGLKSSWKWGVASIAIYGMGMGLTYAASGEVPFQAAQDDPHQWLKTVGANLGVATATYLASSAAGHFLVDKPAKAKRQKEDEELAQFAINETKKYYGIKDEEASEALNDSVALQINTSQVQGDNSVATGNDGGVPLAPRNRDAGQDIELGEQKLTRRVLPSKIILDQYSLSPSNKA